MTDRSEAVEVAERGQDRLPAVLRRLSDRRDDVAEDARGIARAEAELGVRLPRDYAEFIGEFGGGEIDEFAAVVIPYAPDLPGLPSSVVSCTETVREALSAARGTISRFRAEQLICWGSDSDYDYLWYTADADLDNWPVVLMANPAEMVELDCGMAEFLMRALTGQLPEPFTHRWFGDPATFLHWREARRRAGVGQPEWDVWCSG
ncbi:SMI1/KNR4 family protein [Kitasatospora sp. NPDC092948]|uniref:SMI1/KNR4 family protein n=1 Tax=Kitasatospora sp. NPDC092948 TaxID=3364088 RepID=UPI00380BD471